MKELATLRLPELFNESHWRPSPLCISITFPEKPTSGLIPKIVPPALPLVRPLLPINMPMGKAASERVEVAMVRREGGVDVPIPTLVAELV